MFLIPVLRAPPRTTLFPYTTLFRSHLEEPQPPQRPQPIHTCERLERRLRNLQLSQVAQGGQWRQIPKAAVDHVQPSKRTGLREIAEARRVPGGREILELIEARKVDRREPLTHRQLAEPS